MVLALDPWVVQVSAEHDKLVIKALRTAIIVAWFVVLTMIANVVIGVVRSSKCSCPVPAESAR